MHNTPTSINLTSTPVFDLRLEPAAVRFEGSSGFSVLQAALSAGLDLPSSCRNGTCRTCMCTLLTGQVAYRIEWPGLSAEEKLAGLFLPCVAHPASDLVMRLGY